MLMTKDETREAIKVMEAYVEGTGIEKTSVRTMQEWRTVTNVVWNWFDYHYRIKKTPRTFWVYPLRPTSDKWGVTKNDCGLEGQIKVQEVIE